MKNILVPIGGNHKTAINTLQYAIDFAEYLDAKIYLVHVFSSSKISGGLINIDSILEKDGKSILNELLLKVNQKNVKVVSKSLKGHTVIDSIEALTDLLKIDLVIASTTTNTSDKTVFLGKVTGSFVKDLTTPVLIIPLSAQFRPISKVLMTIKSGKIRKESTLNALATIQRRFNSTINLLQVKTPNIKDEDLEINENLNTIISDLILTNNATVFQGVLEFLHEENPDLLCVIRRKRGFFKKLWEDDKVKKIDFESNIPLLVLKGVQ